MSISNPIQAPVMYYGEKRFVSVDFSKQLSIGTSLTGTPTVSVTVLSGTDASPDTIKSGAASVISPRAYQLIQPTVGGVTYLLKFTATTDAATPETLTEYVQLPVEDR